MAELTVAKLLEVQKLLEAEAINAGPFIEIACPWMTFEEAAELQAYIDTFDEDTPNG